MSHYQDSERHVDEEGINIEVSRLIATAEAGNMARDFLDSDIGRYLLKKASIVELEAFREFLSADPKDEQSIREIQEKGRASKSMFAFIRDALTEGQQALETISELKEQGNE